MEIYMQAHDAGERFASNNLSLYIYKFLKSSKGSIFGDNIKWNFAKFLVDKEGRVVDRYAPTTSPLSIEVSCSSTLRAPFHQACPFF
jgi:glutathione peroxidase